MTTLPLLHAVGWSLLHLCWQGTIVALLLACVLRLFSGRSPQSRYMAACLALALMIVLPVVTFMRLAETTHVAQTTTTNPTLEITPPLNLHLNLDQTSDPWLDQVARKLDHAMPWVLAVWLTGVLLLLGRLNIGIIAARRMKSLAAQPMPMELQQQFHKLQHRLAVTRPVKLISSALVQVPTVIGWLRPVVLVPIECLTGLSTLQIEAIFVHELAHIRRHDYLVNLFQSFVEALLFYHPAVWWISKQIRKEREHCCDDLEVTISGDSLAYAKALSSLEAHRSLAPTVALGANGGVLSMRIKRLLGQKQAPVVSRLAALTLLAVVVVAAGLCIATVARAQADTVQNLSTPYQHWVDEDVRWIITPQERTAFLKLSDDQARDAFIKEFWQSRNLNPGDSEDKYRTQHYQRIAYANRHFATSLPGWQTDRGRIYIAYGAPDSIDAHPSVSNNNSAKPNETWHYNTIHEFGPPEHGVGTPGYKAIILTRKDIDMKFVDTCNCGDYKLQPTPES